MRKKRLGAVPAVATTCATLTTILISQHSLAQTPPPPREEAEAEPSPSEQALDVEGAPGTEISGEEGASGSEATPPAYEAAPPAREPSGPLPSSPGLPPSNAGSGGFGLGPYPNPNEDRAALEAQGNEAPTAVDAERIFADDWWAHTRPTVELHGNFRVRADLFSHFSLGRIDPPGSAMWPRPADDYYQDIGGTPHGPQVCTPSEAGTGGSNSGADANQACSNSTQAGANLRFRLEPSIIISDNLRIRSQIDLFDNLVMGSTAQGYSNFPTDGGYGVSQRSGYYPVSGSSWTQDPPVSGINSLSDSIVVKRAWGEYDTPVGQVRFGRMPDHFGLGLLHNAGDDIDGDNQSTVDRIAFVTGLPSLGLQVAGAWDFPYEGATSQAFIQEGRPAYDLAQYDDVSALNLMLFRKIDRQLERRMLARGELVLTGGLYLTYAFQRIANDYSGPSATCANGGSALDCQPGEQSGRYARRGMDVWTPDIYGEVKYKKFRFGAELVTHQGTFQRLDDAFPSGSPSATDQEFRVNQWGFAGELTQLLVEDRLKLGFFFGYASGDSDVNGLVPGRDGLQEQFGDRTISTFRFHPGYRVDMILNRHILSRVQGSYYVKPQVQYDFIREATGMRLGGRAEAIWTRASQFMQTPGHQHDLGIELNGTVYYQSKDGALNDDPDLLGGFFAMIQYGVLFPMSGLGYLAEERPATQDALPGLQTAQNVRLFLGIAY